MIGIAYQARIFIYALPTNMRESFDRLAKKRQVAENKQYYRLQDEFAVTHPDASISGLTSPE